MQLITNVYRAYKNTFFAFVKASIAYEIHHQK